MILVDDGSPDRCGKICDAWAKKDKRIKVIHKPHGGLSDARNAGIELAQGDWLSFADSDDWYAPDMLETLYTLAVENKADFACCNYVSVAEDGKQRKEIKSVTSGVVTQDQYWERLYSSNHWGYYNVIWNKLYKRKLFQTVRFPVGKINEDIYVMHYLVGGCEKIALTDRPEYYYRYRQSSIMGGKRTLGHLDGADAYLCRAEYFIEQKKWRFAEASLNAGKSRLFLDDYGDNGKNSPKYKALKKKVWVIYKQMFTHLSFRRRMSLLFYVAAEPLYAKLYTAGKCRKKHNLSIICLILLLTVFYASNQNSR